MTVAKVAASGLQSDIGVKAVLPKKAVRKPVISVSEDNNLTSC